MADDRPNNSNCYDTQAGLLDYYNVG